MDITRWILAAGVASVVLLAVVLAKRMLLRRLAEAASRTRTGLDDAVVAALGRTQLWLATFVALDLGAQGLDLPPQAGKALASAATIALFLQAGLWASALLEFWVKRSRERHAAAHTGAAASLGAVAYVGRIVLWAVVVLLVLDNLGINVTTLIAGLGIGGVAVALAVQNILGDLFASLSIVLDKPFVVGDFIIVDSYMGTVEHIGLKTTRIRSLDGEQIVFANGDLLKGRIRNYKRMYERRIAFRFGLACSAPPEQVEQVPALVRRLVEAHKGVRFERSHFWRFGESALEFETIFWVTTPDYNVYMDIQQALNLALMRELAARGLRLAFPTRTLATDAPLRVELAAPAPAE